jgi:dGTPase
LSRPSKTIRPGCPSSTARRHASIGARATADYIAGMTDRYALEEHARLFGARPGPTVRA